MKKHIKISIHAPTKGATQIDRYKVCDFGISIHAPTKGATISGSISGFLICYFNPRSHEGSDTLDTGDPSWCPNFNPRSHEGSDYDRLRSSRQYTDFNPRSHEGSDVRSSLMCGMSQISIHAPTKGATFTIEIEKSMRDISIHAPTKGATA